MRENVRVLEPILVQIVGPLFQIKRQTEGQFNKD